MLLEEREALTPPVAREFQNRRSLDSYGSKNRPSWISKVSQSYLLSSPACPTTFDRLGLWAMDNNDWTRWSAVDKEKSAAWEVEEEGLILRLAAAWGFSIIWCSLSVRWSACLLCLSLCFSTCEPFQLSGFSLIDWWLMTDDWWFLPPPQSSSLSLRFSIANRFSYLAFFNID